jgi:hypothetical protein
MPILPRNKSLTQGIYWEVILLKIRYQEDGLMAHARLNDGSVLIFRGKDQNGRMVLLRLSNLQPTKKKDGEMKISLTLSYIEKPDQPDAFQLKENDF